MQKIDFKQFKRKNPNYREAFEELCYHLFCRKFNLAEGVRADFNEIGLETKPVLFKKKRYGFQAKFFEHKNNGEQIKESVKKAIKKFKGNLDCIYIYLNNPIGTRAKYDKKIEKIANKNKIEIEWIIPSNFKILINQPSNFDLAQLYFGHGDEFGFIRSNCDSNIITFLQSSTYLSLPFKTFKGNIIEEILTDSKKEFLILGHPGSGKTILMNRLIVEFGGLNQKNRTEMKKIIIKNKALPMLINLKDCSSDTLENIIRNRQKDYKVRKKKIGFIYIFDGLDEINSEKADNVLSYIFTLAKDEQTKKIIISCRSGNYNKYLFKTYFPDTKEYEIDQLGVEYIDKYFTGKNDEKKLKKLENLKKENGEVLKDIKDVFLIDLFWSTAEKISKESSIIDLFRKKINLLLEDPRFKKNIEELNLLDPKKDIIISLNQDISFKFQKKLQYRFNQKEIQALILKKLPRLSYKETNAVLSYLCSQFFNSSKVDKLGNQSFIYQHRRYQEFFFAQKLKSEYEKNRRILRDLNILSNRDFFEKLFLPYLYQEYKKESNLPKLIELNLINIYLGKYKGYGPDEPYYMNSSSFIPSLAHQDNIIFEQLLSDENLQIKEKLPSEPENIALFWKMGKQNFAQELLNNFEKIINQGKKGEKEVEEWINTKIWQQWQSWLYIQIVINQENISKIFKNLIRKNYQYSSSEKIYSFEESEKEKLVKSFFRVCLDEKQQEFLKLVDSFDEYEFLAFLDVLSEIDYIPHLIGKSVFHSKIKSFLESYPKEITEGNSFILFYKKFFNIILTNKEKTFAKEQLSTILNKNRYFDWHREHYKYALISYAMGEKTFDQMSANLNKTIPNYYNELFLFAALFYNFIGILENKKSIESTVSNYISYINSHRKIGELYLEEDISSLWSYIFSNCNSNDLVTLKNIIIKNKKDIVPFFLLWKLRLKDKQCFNKLVNEQEIEDLAKELANWKHDFPSYVNRCFNLAILFSTINYEKAVLYTAKGINEGILRHGWRKDIIVSYKLVDALEILWRNNWKSKQMLKKYTKDIFDLALRVSDITDGRGTWRGPYNVLDIAAKYDIKLAEKLKNKLYKKKGNYNTSNYAITLILLGKVKRGVDLDQIEEEMSEYRKDYDYENKPSANYYEQKFLVFLAVTRSDLYSPEEKKQAFIKTYEQVEEMIKSKISSFLKDIDFKTEKEYFKELCKKYNKKYNIPIEKEEREYFIKMKISEEDFICEVQNATTKQKIYGLYRRLRNYENGIILKQQRSWEILVSKTYEIYEDIELLIKYLKDNYYPHTDFWTSNSMYFHYAISTALQNINMKTEMLEYLYNNSGHQGFINIMKAYEVNNEKKMCLKLFEEFYGFCDFLVN